MNVSDNWDICKIELISGFGDWRFNGWDTNYQNQEEMKGYKHWTQPSNKDPRRHRSFSTAPHCVYFISNNGGESMK